MKFEDLFQNVDVNEVFNTVKKAGVKNTVSSLTNAYKSAVVLKHQSENIVSTVTLAMQHPELIKTFKYNFNDMAQLVNITANVANDSKTDIRKLPKKIGDVEFKVTRAPKAPKPQ